MNRRARPFLGTFAAAILLVVLAPLNAAAEWQFAPIVGYTFKGSTTLVDFENAFGKRHWHFGGAVTLVGEGPFGVEGYYLRTPNMFQNKDANCTIETCVTSDMSHALMGNAVLTIPRGWNRYGLRPFVSGGLGLLHASKTDQRNLLPVDLNLLGMNAGGGAVGYFTDRVGARFDLRYFRNIRGVSQEDPEVPPTLGGEPVRLRYWALSFGVVFKY